MKTSWLIGIITLYILLQIASGIGELTYPGSAETNRLVALMNPDIPVSTNPIGAVVAYITAGWHYIQNLWGCFWFDYSFFQGGWLMAKYAIFWPVSIGVVVSIVFAVFRGVPSN